MVEILPQINPEKVTAHFTKGHTMPPRVKADRKAPHGFRWIFVKQFRHWRSGKIVRAEDHGREAFYFLVRDRKAA